MHDTDPTETPDAVIARIEARFPMPQPELARYERRRWVLSHLPKGGVGAEIGVFRGHFAELICAVAKPRKLYLVDPWRRIGPTYTWVEAYTNNGTLTTEAAWQEARARVGRHPEVELVQIEGYYPVCADRIDEPLDFAYLDASHSYASTLAELRALERQVKPGGAILGDDWHPDPASAHHGVFRAVQDFVVRSDWQIFVCGPGGQWMLRKRPLYA
jgi:hypothetical protein